MKYSTCSTSAVGGYELFWGTDCRVNVPEIISVLIITVVTFMAHVELLLHNAPPPFFFGDNGPAFIGIY